MELNSIPISRGLFITTSTFVPRATTIGIRTVDGEELSRMEKRALFVRFKKMISFSSLLFLSASFLLAHFVLEIDSIEKAKKTFKQPHLVVNIYKQKVGRMKKQMEELKKKIH